MAGVADRCCGLSGSDLLCVLFWSALRSWPDPKSARVEGFNLYPTVWYIMAPPLFTLAASLLFVRLRRAIGVERQQIKWFAYAVAMVPIGIILAFVIPEVRETPLWFKWAGYALFVISGSVGVPSSVEIAILRYRIYEIDFLINPPSPTVL